MAASWETFALAVPVLRYLNPALGDLLDRWLHSKRSGCKLVSHSSTTSSPRGATKDSGARRIRTPGDGCAGCAGCAEWAGWAGDFSKTGIASSRDVSSEKSSSEDVSSVIGGGTENFTKISLNI